jgi:hypothetical protein
MIAPEMPRGEPVRQPVLHDQAHRKRDDSVGIMTPRRGKVIHRGVEAEVAGFASMFGIRDVEVQGTVTPQAANVVQGAPPKSVTIG